MCAQEIFSSFVSAAANNIKEISGETKLGENRQKTERGENFLLHNAELNKIAAAFQESGLGSVEDCYMCIIPALRTSSKLPSFQKVQEDLRRLISSLRKEGLWQESTKLLWWIHRCIAGLRHGGFEEAETDLGEHFKSAMWHVDPKTQRLGFEGVHKMLEDIGSSGVPAEYGWVALQIAAEKWDEDMRDRLCKAGANADLIEEIDVHLDLVQAATVGQLTVVRFRLDPKDVETERALVSAAEKGHCAVVQLLLQSNINLEAKDDTGRTVINISGLNQSDEN